MGPAVVYVFYTRRNAKVLGGAERPELVHNRSGVGPLVMTADLNGRRG
jgi:hypothetical protein